MRIRLAIVAIVVALASAGCDSASPTPPPAGNAPPAAAQPAITPQATVNSSDTADQHLQKAEAAVKSKQFDVAQAEALAAVKGLPQSSQAQFVLGNAYNQAASFEADMNKRGTLLNLAIAAYEAAIKLDPKNDAAFTNLGTVYYQTGEFTKAQEEALKALAIKPNDARTHYLLGTIYMQTDPSKDSAALDKAQAEFESAVKNEPDLGAAYIGLSNVHLAKNNIKDALSTAQKGVDLMKSDPDPFAIWALARAQCQSGDKVNGSKSIEQINQLAVPDAAFMQQVRELAARCK